MLGVVNRVALDRRYRAGIGDDDDNCPSALQAAQF
jgi:hypothetical protein